MTARNRHLALVASLLCALALLPLAGCGESSGTPGKTAPRVTASIPAQQQPADPADTPKTTAASDNENNVSPLLTAKVEKPAATDQAEGEAKPKFDPERINGKFFEGWKTPRLALLITGRQDGYLEPCGCA